MTAERLAALHARLDGCRLCLEAGYDVYPRAIYSGRVGARIMTVGQAPGITEKVAGRPFNAGSGTRLFNWLAQAGIDEAWFRSTQYMTSVTKCFPGKAKSGPGDRVPSRAEQELCRPYLDEELALIDPELIIPIGNLAIGVFFPEKPKLADLIGTEKEEGGRWIVPLPHPSGASRWTQLPENRALIEKAIGLIGGHYQRIFVNLAKV
jgi:uracil-DNA glycosylase